jgi:hypothetical protein
MVRQDVAIAVDQEARPGAAARTVAFGRRLLPLEQFRAVGQRHRAAPLPWRARNGRVDVDDGRIEPFGDVGKRRHRRHGRAGGRRPPGGRAQLGFRVSGRRSHRSCDDQADQERHGRNQADRDGQEPAGH